MATCPAPDFNSRRTRVPVISSNSSCHQTRQRCAPATPQRVFREDLAQRLVDDVPNFQLAQLAYADLLTAQTHRLPIMGAAPKDLVSQASARLDQLRAEANRRVAAQRNRPPAGSIPAQFIEIAPSTKFAIAVDASRSRLYLLQNGPHGMQVIEDHYASVGRLGTDKKTEGDQP